MKMKKISTIIFLSMLAAIFISCTLFAQKPVEKYNSFKPGQLWLDNNGIFINAHGGGLIYYNKKYYWFGEHKIEGKKGNSAQVGVHCYSSADLYNWKDEGIALKVSNDNTSEIAKGCILERPKVIYNVKTKKFVMWFHLEHKGKGYATARSAVAISDIITGPYTFVKSIRINANTYPVNLVASDTVKSKENFFSRDFNIGQMARDMNLFVDDDGKAYHIFSSEENRTMHISQLTDDYMTPSGKYIRISKDKSREAPAIFKHNGKYYLITSACTGWAPNAATIAVADNILGEWKVIDNPCQGPDADLTFKGQSTYVLPVQGMKDAFIFIADRWEPDNAIDGRYLWLPIHFEGDKITIPWIDEWNLGFFKTKK